MSFGKQWELTQMLKIRPTTKFKKDLKKYEHQTKLMQDLNNVLHLLVQKKPLAKKHVDHPLKGIWKESRECHINPDTLLIYRVDDSQKILFLERLGSHSELF